MNKDEFQGGARYVGGKVEKAVGDVVDILPDPAGNQVSSTTLLASGPLVVTFYRGVWCPFCNYDLTALEEARSEIEARGATLVAISQQTAPNSRKSQRQNGLAAWRGRSWRPQEKMAIVQEICAPGAVPTQVVRQRPSAAACATA